MKTRINFIFLLTLLIGVCFFSVSCDLLTSIDKYSEEFGGGKVTW